MKSRAETSACCLSAARLPGRARSGPAARCAGAAWRWLWRVAGLCVSAAVISAPAAAQERPERPAALQRAARGETRPQDGSRAEKRPQDRPRDGGPARPLAGGLALPRGFSPTAEDFGPLQPGEDEQLSQFTQRFLPQVARALQEIRSRNPGAYADRLAELTPRVRALRRVMREDQALGRKLLRHIENEQMLRRARRVFQSAPQTGPARQRILSEARERIGENIAIESDMLLARAAQMRTQRERWIEQTVALLLSDDADASEQPERLKAVARRIREASDDQKPEMIQRLRETLAERGETDAADLERRAAEIQSNREAMVDRRINAFFGGSPPGGP
ncbi:MAG: hypothetical protein CHACPFDD_02779 [Phycisphaerae bacterium]|nr:hypothetical protein [Phycisphaerae bacterium]